ncbi:interleukin-12 subunit alpha isoform X1 [Takifugu rubripes]|uniref:interleukin-12 subunit alpha isoform X1 n=1 Tax=Takifugu rubripes TaxID=31033 RepID=UPI001145B108|nr:uncharacterized protein LOC101061955 isoform X1 [Takifugu rubripes]
MAIVPSYVSSSLLLMMMMLMVTWRASSAGPVRASNVERCQGCPSLFRNLLGNIRELLKSEDLRFGITSSSVVVSSKSNTLLACTPTPTQNTNCLIQRNSSFSETECMRNIMRDLDHYAAAIRSYLKAPIRSSEREEKLLSPTVEMIQDLRKCCSQSEEEDSSSQVLVLVFTLVSPLQGEGTHFKSMKQAVILLWLLPGQRCQPVGQQLLQQQAEDVEDDEGLLHPGHHHQQSRGLHRLRRAQEVSCVQTTIPDRPLPSLSNQVKCHTASDR